MKKIGFQDLDSWLKAAVIYAYIVMTIFFASMIYYIAEGIVYGV